MIKKDRFNHIFLWTLCVVFLLFISGCGLRPNYSAQTKADSNSTSLESETTQSVESIVDKKTDPIVGSKKTFKDLGLGGLAKVEDYYIGLQYIKSMSYLPTALGKEDIGSESEVIIPFFEIYNAASDSVNIDLGKISCYADGVQVSGVETNIKVFVDGVHQFSTVTLDPGYHVISCKNYEVLKDWKELKFYNTSDCVWTVSKKEVSSEDYVHQSIIGSFPTSSSTEIDEILFSDRYQIQFKGHILYHDEDSWNDATYIVFKFQIKNLSVQDLDTSLMGYKMRAYQDSFLLDDATFALNDKIDGFLNIYMVDSIAPEMVSNIYVAFQADKSNSEWALAYDDGYITSHYCGMVYVSDKKGTESSKEIRETTTEQSTENTMESSERTTEIMPTTQEAEITEEVAANTEECLNPYAHIGVYELITVIGEDATYNKNDLDEYVASLGKTGPYETLELKWNEEAIIDYLTDIEDIHCHYKIESGTSSLLLYDDYGATLDGVLEGDIITIHYEDDNISEVFKKQQSNTNIDTVAGTYILIGFNTEGTLYTSDDLEALSDSTGINGAVMSLVLTNDGKASLDSALEDIDSESGYFTLNGNDITITLGGDPADGIVEGNTIILSGDGTEMVFEKQKD